MVKTWNLKRNFGGTSDTGSSCHMFQTCQVYVCLCNVASLKNSLISWIKTMSVWWDCDAFVGLVSLESKTHEESPWHSHPSCQTWKFPLRSLAGAQFMEQHLVNNLELRDKVIMSESFWLPSHIILEFPPCSLASPAFSHIMTYS